MCFSAPASFTASVLLAAVGTALLCQDKTRRLLPLALIPWFFAIQQGAEGIVWLSLSEAVPSLLASAAKNVFLFFAFVFWPIWLPLSVWLVEVDAWRKQAMAVCLGIGLLLGVFLAFGIPHAAAVAYRCSIQYKSGFSMLEQFYGGSEPAITLVVLLFYAMATVLPLFFSSLKRMKILAVLVTLSGVAIYEVDQLFFVSMWCFSAALFSACLFFVRRREA